MLYVDKCLVDEVKHRILALGGWDCDAFLRFRSLLEDEYTSTVARDKVEHILREFNALLSFCFSEGE